MRVYIISMYFGVIPNYFQLWLNSCGKNKKYSWIFFTDAETKDFEFPENVGIINTSINDIKKIFSEIVGFEVSLESAYKLCDYRPLYWAILDKFNIDYDYWGHCDIDMIFGDIDKYVKPIINLGYEKIFSMGHLTLYKNSNYAKNAYKNSEGKLDWVKIFNTTDNIGFDEHHGINKKISKNKSYINEKIILDVLPEFKSLVINGFLINKSSQRILYNNGKIYLCKKSFFQDICIKEYMYVHIQKRKMKINCDLKSEKILINGDGFFDFDKNYLNDFTNKITLSEFVKYLKYIKRYFKSKIYQP